jgi:uncharacterized YigZ family protein
LRGFFICIRKGVFLSDTYLSLKSRSRSEIKVVGSKFIASVQSVKNLQEAESFLKEMREEFWDASHNCYGFHIEGTDIRYSDDGEPSGTAGKPIYDQIKGKKLLYSMVVVTRYFGGTKLGTGGLIRAYGDSAKLGLEEAQIIEIIRKDKFEIKYSYDDTSVVMRILNTFSADILSTDYSNLVKIYVAVRKSESGIFSKKIFEAGNGRVSVIKK